MWQEERTTVWCVCTCDTKISRKFFLQSGRLAIACFFICSPLGHSLLLHFSAVSLACSIGVDIAVVVAEVRLLCADLESAKEDLPN